MPLPVHNDHPLFFVLGEKIRQEFRVYPGDDLLERAKREGCGVYYTPNALGESRNDKGNLRHKHNVTRFNTFFADFDAGDKLSQQRRIDGSPIRPTAIVESGRGYHTYWAIDGNCDLETWERTQRAIAAYFGSDSNVSDGARLMRLPGSWHVKEGYEPSIVKIIYSSDTVYSAPEVIRSFPSKERPKLVFTLSDSNRLQQAYTPVDRPLHANHRHAELIREAARGYALTPPAYWGELREKLTSWYIINSIPLKKNWQEEIVAVFDHYEKLEAAKR